MAGEIKFVSGFGLCLLFGWLLAASPSLLAQPRNLPLEFQHIQEAQGLSYNVINTLLQDQQGYLWIGTYEGLNRFDGSHFTVFKATDQVGSLPNNIVHDLCQDKAGNLWLATDDGISRRDSRTGQFYATRLMGTEKLGRCMNILCDRKGRIWFSSLLKGLFQLDPKSGRCIQFKNSSTNPATLSGDYISKNGMVEDPHRDGLWLTTEQNGLNYLDIASGQFFNHRNNPEHLPILQLHDTSALVLDGNKLLFADNTDQRIVVYDLVSKTISNTISLTSQTGRSAFPVGTIFVDRNHTLWISSWTYIMFTVEAGQYKAREFFHDEARRTSIAGDFFWAGWQQNDGTIWLGTVNGISYTNPGNTFYSIHDLAQQYPPLSRKQGLTAFLEDDAGNWWFLSVDGELLTYQPVTGHLTVNTIPPAMRGAVWSGQSTLLVGLNPDELYIRRSKAVVVFNKRTKTFRPFPLPQSMFSHADDLRAMVRQADWLWVFGTSDVIFRCHLPSGRWQTFPLPSNDGTKYRVYAAGVDRTGRLWADVRDKGLIWFSVSQQRFVSFPVLSRTSTSYANHLIFATDAQNRLWLPASGQGLIEVDPRRSTSRTWTNRDGLSTNECKAVCADAYGQIWMASLNKFSIINPDRSSVQNLTLALNESNIGYTNYMFTLRNGNLITTMKNYVVEFMPHRINRQIAPAKVLISTLALPDTSLIVRANSPTLQLGVSSTNFSISYSVLNRVQQHYVYFYMLEGYDDHWVKADARTVANYTKIPGGDYTFRVKAVAGKSETGETILPIHIDTAFYNTRWFRLAVLLLLLGLTYRFYRYRIRQTARLHHFRIQTTRLERDKAEIQYQNLINHLNPHFLFNSLTSLNSLILTRPKEATIFLRKLSLIYRYILQNKDKELVSLQDELTFAQNYIDLQMDRYGESLQISLRIDPAHLLYQIVPVTIQNLLENVIKHNVIDEESPLQIQVYTQDATLFVVNNLQKKDIVETSNKQGLASLQSLYTYLSRRKITVTQTDTHFIVGVPLL